MAAVASRWRPGATGRVAAEFNGRVGRNVSATTKGSTMFRRGVLRRCPVCGGGHLFRRWLHMAPACPTCGFVFKRVPGQWLGSWFLNVIAVQAVVCALLFAAVAATWPDTPSALLIGLAVGAAVAVPLLFFPFSRTIWSAIDLIMKPIGFDEGVAPGLFLEAELDELVARERATPQATEATATGDGDDGGTDGRGTDDPDADRAGEPAPDGPEGPRRDP